MKKIVLCLGVILSVCVLASCATQGSNDGSRQGYSDEPSEKHHHHHHVDYKGESQK